MTALPELARLLSGQQQPCLVARVVSVDGLSSVVPGAVRAHRPGCRPLGDPFGAGLDEALTGAVREALEHRGPACLATVTVASAGSAVVMLQWSDELPAAVWDLLQTGCAFALHTRWQSGRVTTRAVVRVPSALADTRACHAIDLLLSGTSQVVLSRDAGDVRLVETFCAPRRLVCVGSGPLDHALADACPLTLWAYQHRDVSGADDLADLTAHDLLVVLNTPRAWEVVALALASPVGHVGLIDPAAGSLAGTAVVQERLHVLDPGEADCPPFERAIIVLSELMASRRDQARRTWGSMVLTG